MSLIKELIKHSPPKPEESDSRYEELVESIEDLYERWSLFGNRADKSSSGEKRLSDPTKKLSMARIHTVMLSPSDKSFGLKDKVFGIRNEDPIVEFLLDILGVPLDGMPVYIRSGFMKYDKNSKMLFIARNKSDLPGGRTQEKETK